MKRFVFFLMIVLGGLVIILGYSSISDIRAKDFQIPHINETSPIQPSQSFKMDPAFGKIPLYFIPNYGQMNKTARFYANTSRYTLWITKEGLVFDSIKSNLSNPTPKRDVSRLSFVGASKNPDMSALELTDHNVHYYKGKDRSKWATDIQTSRAVLMKNVFNHIDLKIYGNESEIEYDWIVNPGGNPSDIRFKYENVENSSIDPDGNLKIKTEFGFLIHKKPIGYQSINGNKTPVLSRFESKGQREYGFYVENFTGSSPLIIDPTITLEYCSYLGGSDEELYPRITVTNSGHIYMVGYTMSADFPVVDAYQNTLSCSPCAILTKISSDGSSLMFSTYFGGNGAEYYNAIAMSGKGDLYIAGDTFSTDLPAVNEYNGNKDIFIARFDTSGHFISGRYVGGGDEDRDLDITFYQPDSVLITGFTYSQDFPLKDPFQSDGAMGGYSSAYITKLKADLSEIEYSTFLGGAAGDNIASRILSDSSGYVYVFGRTSSHSFPTNHAYQGYFKGGTWDLFYTKFKPGEPELEFSTYLGGSGDEYAADMAINIEGSVYIQAITQSDDFPLKNPYQSTRWGGWDFTLTRIHNDAPLLDFSTYFGGIGDESQGAISLDEQGNLLVTGTTASIDFPTKYPLRMTLYGATDAFVSIFAPNGKDLLLSTFIGGSAKDYGRDILGIGDHILYIAGTTESSDLELKNPYQDSYHGNGDIYFAKFSYTTPPSYYTLTVQSDPTPGVTIQVTPLDENSAGNGVTNFTRKYKYLPKATLIAPQTFNSRNFYRWVIDGTPNSNRTIQVDMNENHTVTVHYRTPSLLILNRSRLNFGADTAGVVTGPQTFSIGKTGETPLDWTISDNMSWLTCAPATGTDAKEITVSVDATGFAVGSYTGTISVSAPNAANSPQVIPVFLTVRSVINPSVPFGYFETPQNGANVYSSIAVTGWALDDIEVTGVKLYRQMDSNLVFLGDGVFVEGARPDVELAYPSYPGNTKAGWGYMMLTNSLPNGGNGDFTLVAIATDKEGNQVTLGSKTIHCDNEHAVKPFGAIDTPTQGGTASGKAFVNFGWVLAPKPNMIPKDGSTIHVLIDGVSVGRPVYNNYREDIATIFPGYYNSDGACGYYYIDTTKFSDGLHTIQWTATDTIGNTDGIGSRYFTIRNGVQASTHDKRTNLSELAAEYKPVSVKTGYSPTDKPRIISPDKEGVVHVKIEEMGRLEIVFSSANSRAYFTGASIVGTQRKPLPVGSFLDGNKGVFYWQPGPGFVGKYRLVFIETSRNGEMKKRIIDVTIR